MPTSSFPHLSPINPTQPQNRASRVFSFLCFLIFISNSQMPAELAAGKRAAPPRVDDHQHEQLPCPRCDSTNTKFCYYNNYNFSQPRHFCKSCRRYWTHGGTLRDVPVGGSSRKSVKRLRSTTVMSQPAPEPMSATPVFGPTNGGGGGVVFASLLSGFELGFGLGLGLENVEFGLGRGFWTLPEVGYNLSGGATVGSGGGGGGGGGGRGGSGHLSTEDTWQMGTGGESGYGVAASDCFASLPELATAPHRYGLK